MTEIEMVDILKKDLKGRQKKIEKLMVTCARYKYKADLYEQLYSKMCKDNIILAGELAAYKEKEEQVGQWIDDKCSVCGKGIDDLIDSHEWYRNEQPNFCPFCGVKIEGVEE